VIDGLRAVAQERWFCRISSGAHSFLLERNSYGSCCIYQSFFGAASVDVSVDNIRGNKGVFQVTSVEGKRDFFNRLESALLDTTKYLKTRPAEIKAAALEKGKRKKTTLTVTEVDELLTAYGKAHAYWKPEPQPILNTVSKELLEILKEADGLLDQIEENVSGQIKNQQELFHGMNWTTKDPVQYRLNIDPAADDQIVQNICKKIKPYEQKWDECFQSSGAARDQLMQIGVKL
jgi:hypothetical protein